MAIAQVERRVEGRRIHISGTVQGVGFRPFVFGLAARLGDTALATEARAQADELRDQSAIGG
jgi:acylphosphatase